MYQNYVFDLYGTLVDIHTDEEIPELWEKLTIFYASKGASYSSEEIKEVYAELCQKEKKRVQEEYQVKHADIKIEAVFQGLFERKGVKASEELITCTANFFRLLSLDYVKLYDGVLDLFEKLREKGKQIILLSNAQRFFTEPELRYLGLYDKFDKIYISSDYYCAKPDLKFYQNMLDELGLDKKETIMIGNDEITDIKGSYEAGLDSLYIHSNISPEIKGELLSKFTIMDGDVRKIADMILKE
ncbi:MAG: HAD family hydrolase [Lachnospiraceae bacterium]|nr:HAD family hydrolase [Lachnospiraceae bacterium]